MVRSRPAGSSQNGRNPTKHARRNSAMATGCCRIPAMVTFSLYDIFSCEPNVEKYFFKKMIFLKNIFRRKPFFKSDIYGLEFKGGHVPLFLKMYDLQHL